MDRGKRPMNTFGPAARDSTMKMVLKDIIRERALQFLPAKLLFKLRGICRDWKLQIDAPLFEHRQSVSCRAVSGFFTQAPGEPPSLICIDPSSCGVPNPSLRFLPEPVDIRSSSNGLLLCQGRGEDRAYYVCNPALQQWRKLPKPNGDHGHQPAIVLINEPSSLLNFEVDYKIVCAFACSEFDDAIEFELYSASEESWEISREISFANIEIDPKSGVHANGIVYWQGRGLISYDLSRDRCQWLERFRGGGILGTIYGKPCMAATIRRAVSVAVLEDVPLMRWIIKEKMTFPRFYQDRTLIVRRDNLLLFKSNGVLYCYDLHTEETKNLGDASEHSNTIYLPYVNNFASL